MKLTNCAASAQLANIERLYLEAFPAVERKPFPLMVQKSQEGIRRRMEASLGLPLQSCMAMTYCWTTLLSAPIYAGRI